MFTEMTDVSRDARISLGLRRHVQRRPRGRMEAHRRFRACAVEDQVLPAACHAGRKGATKLMWEGIDEPLEQGGWPIISASPLPYYPHSAVPREMTRGRHAGR